MVQAKNGTLIATIIVCFVLLAGLMFYLAPEEPEPIVLPDYPTASEIAALVNVDTNVDVRYDNLDDILLGVYPDEVSSLEDDCQADLWDEFGDDAEDDIKDAIEDKLGFEIEDLDVVDWDYDEDYNFDVVNLGLDDFDDRAADITTTLRIKYHEVFGDSDWHYVKVDVKGSCRDWDSSDNEFDELTASYIV